MSYAVELTRRAERDLRRLPQSTAERVTASLLALEDDPRPSGSRKLQASDEWRLRVGDYRVRYRIDDSARRLTITRIAHRREVYRP